MQDTADRTEGYRRSRNEMYLQLCGSHAAEAEIHSDGNVPNMLLMRGGMFRERITRAFRDAGYDNQAVAVLDASLYGFHRSGRECYLGGAGECFRFPLQDALEQTAHSLEQDPSRLTRHFRSSGGRR